MNSLESRGTVRLALKNAGLDAKGVTPDQMTIVLSKVLPGELAQRAVEAGESLCKGIIARMATRQFDAGGGEQVEEVFGRMGARS